MKKNVFAGIVLCVCLALVSGCSYPGMGSKTYTSAQAQTPMIIYSGTLIKVSDVTLADQPSGAGTVIGGVAGAVLGSTMGRGPGRDAATAAGALIGMGVGTVVEKDAATRPALELEVQMDDGRRLVIVQEKDDTFNVGDRVRVIEDNYGRMRVRESDPGIQNQKAKADAVG